VYKAVLAIPAGNVRSYGWVAAKIGCPGAARAVGNALNKNPYAPLVPCHRVVRSDGFVGGFARGIAAKRRLLEREGIDVERLRLL
jgi:O-6-methylguanine DNA methyltransferase